MPGYNEPKPLKIKDKNNPFKKLIDELPFGIGENKPDFGSGETMAETRRKRERQTARWA